MNLSNIFNLDNGFFRVLTKIIDCAYVSVLFIFTSIPVFTIGASYAAMYYTIQKVIKHDRGYVSSEYWSAFKSNFKQGTVLWLLVLAIELVLYMDMQIMKFILDQGNPIGKIYMFFAVLMFLVIILSVYAFSYIARFQNKNKEVIKNAILLALAFLPRTLLIMVFSMVAFAAVCIIPMSLIIVPGFYTWAVNLNLEKIFRKYMDKEDREYEDDMNREYKN